MIICRICSKDMSKEGTIKHWQKHHPKEYLRGVNNEVIAKRKLGIL